MKYNEQAWEGYAKAEKTDTTFDKNFVIPEESWKDKLDLIDILTRRGNESGLDENEIIALNDLMLQIFGKPLTPVQMTSLSAFA